MNAAIVSLSMGVEWIWIVDPCEETATVYSGANPAGEQVDTLRTKNPAIAILLADVLNPRRQLDWWGQPSAAFPPPRG